MIAPLAARRVLEAYEREVAGTSATPDPARRLLGELLVHDAVSGLEHPEDSERIRPGLGGLLGQTLFGALFAAVAWFMRTGGMVDLDDPTAALADSGTGGGTGGVFDLVLWGFLALGLVTVLRGLGGMAVRLWTLVVGTRLRASAADGLPSGLSDEDALRRRLHASLADRLSWRRRSRRRHR